MTLYDRAPLAAVLEACARPGPSAGRWEIPTDAPEVVVAHAKDAMGIALDTEEKALLAQPIHSID